MANSHLTMALELAPTPRLTQLVNRATGRDCLAGRQTEPLVALTLDGKTVATDGLKLAGEPKVTRSPGRVAAEIRYNVTAWPGLAAVLRVELDGQPEVAFELAFENYGALPAQMGFAGPDLGWFCLGADLGQNYYLFPKCGAAFHNAPANHRARYCGAGMPLQFMSVVNPDAGEGLYLRTEDTAGVWRHYGLRKTEKGMSLGLDYPSESLEPGATRRGVRTVIGVTGGDWHDGFEAYRGWLRTWYKPVAPRKAWFREVFNFRQRFLWWLDPLYDPKAGEFHLEAAVDEAKEKFGGLEYLHIFDWGNCGKYGRIYGRTGDHSPYDYWKGGKDAFKRAIAGVQAQGVRVGLYIEGYLLQEKGKLGEAHGKAWQLIRKDGSRAYWPKSTEMFVCPWVPDWRDVQASTYSARVSELGVDGMYLDQFGFANERKDCYSKEHGHPMPGYAVLGERGCSKRVRDAIDAAKPGVALYSEECPVDVNSQNQDGSFTYAMATTRRTETLVPLNMLRFAIPSFKTFEILICDKPTGTWATGIKWVFFNGEGIWLEGQADEWFAPETLATIRQCHAILREHKDAFTSDAPVPLVPTEAGGVFANFFPTAGKQVYTLYNSRHRTFIGEALRLRRVPGVRYHDAWNERPIEARRDGEFDVLSTTIAPQGVGCIVVTGKG
ncbi:MAG: hypothetical protein FJ279_15695 [Planctomycetes bacterium]|nr:hypothetical protein [Planctomycetota bacterium]